MPALLTLTAHLPALHVPHELYGPALTHLRATHDTVVREQFVEDRGYMPCLMYLENGQLISVPMVWGIRAGLYDAPAPVAPPPPDFTPCAACTTGECPACDGRGYFERDPHPTYTPQYIPCSTCGGSGLCYSCGGDVFTASPVELPPLPTDTLTDDEYRRFSILTDYPALYDARNLARVDESLIDPPTSQEAHERPPFP